MQLISGETSCHQTHFSILQYTLHDIQQISSSSSSSSSSSYVAVTAHYGFLAFSAIFFHSILSLLSFLPPLIPIVWISSSKSSIHLFLGRPLILLHTDFHSNILQGILPPSIHITCPSQAILLLFINLTMEYGAFVEWYWDSSNERNGRQSVPVTLYLLKLSPRQDR